jgi:hypothetical protein
MVCKNPGRACLLATLLLPGMSTAAGLNDTGQTACQNDTGVVSPEPSTHPRQDCTRGRDAAAAAGVLPKTGAGSAGFDYTKIAADGSDLPVSATSWSCVRDNLTGLIWELKTNGAMPDLRDRRWTYCWYDDIHNDNNGGIAGWNCRTPEGQCSVENFGGVCNTQTYIAAVNAAGLCGHSDWRLPIRLELQGLVHYTFAEPGPTIDSGYFPDYPYTDWTWTSSTDAQNPYTAWAVSFRSGSVFPQTKVDNKGAGGAAFSVRLVRGGQ